MTFVEFKFQLIMHSIGKLTYRFAHPMQPYNTEIDKFTKPNQTEIRKTEEKRNTISTIRVQNVQVFNSFYPHVTFSQCVIQCFMCVHICFTQQHMHERSFIPIAGAVCEP